MSYANHTPNTANVQDYVLAKVLTKTDDIVVVHLITKRIENDVLFSYYDLFRIYNRRDHSLLYRFHPRMK